MVTAYYEGMLVLSIVLMLFYCFSWHKHFDVHITLMFVIVPISNLGYAMMAHATTIEEIIACNKITYIGGCYAMLMMMLMIYSLCDLKMNRWLRMFFLMLSSTVFFASLSIGRSELFYKSFTFERINDTVILHKQYGPIHTLFYVMIFLYFLLSIAAMAYTFFHKTQVSRKLIAIMFTPVAAAMLVFFTPLRNLKGIELIGAAYNLALINNLMIVHRIELYDITDTAIDTIVEKGDTGFASFDYHLNYLASNQKAREILPALGDLIVDYKADRNEAMQETAIRWIKDYQRDPTKNTALYEKGDRTYLIVIRDLFDGLHKRGYQIFMTDDTPNQQYIRLINHFNEDLQNEVDAKTKHIVEMHDNLIMSMATMVESRDNSTGGHIRRTSEGVRILIDEIQKNNVYQLSDSFCRNLIKAAPMHDLGKIAVDDEVLRKPGRFTPEEYEKMKYHAPEGARIVHEILKGTDDPEFRRIAENVAHYHHERWDGSGYPDGLKGEAIPPEARIMAVADVYDALVSRRVYKEKMSFEKADAIIMEGMGSQFDPKLEPYYVSARPKLEAYYSSLENA